MDNDLEIKPEVDAHKTILIFGVSSFIGSNLAEFFKKDYKVIGTFNSTPIKIKGVLTIHCDVMDKDAIQMIMYTFKPDYTIYAVGRSGLSEGHHHPGETDNINTNCLFTVVDYCQRYKSKFIFFSTHHVFAGKNEKKLLEMDIPDPITQYGKSKTSAEFYIQKNSLDFLIFRTCQFYGRGYKLDGRSWFEHIQHCFQNNQTLNCDDFVKCGFLDISYLSMLLKLCLEKDVQNRLLQICSEDVMTHYDFAKTYCEVFNYSDSLVHKSKWNFHVLETANIEKFTPVFHLDVGNLSTHLNIKIPTIRESLEFTFNRFHGVSGRNKHDSGEGIRFI